MVMTRSLGDILRGDNDVLPGRFLLDQIQLHERQQDIEAVAFDQYGLQILAGDDIAANGGDHIILAPGGKNRRRQAVGGDAFGALAGLGMASLQHDQTDEYCRKKWFHLINASA